MPPTLLTHETLNPEAFLAELTIDEKISLLSGIDMWHTAAIDRLGLPSIRMSDGPNGIRGTRFFNGVPANCFPSASALGATFDVDLLKEVGSAIADEAISKGAAICLGPTVNIQRNPLAGRGFESYSEDPLLSGKLAGAFINGLQSKHVAATIKHFVANDSEFQRTSMSSEVPARALREIYLRPFEIALRESNPYSFMTGYNRLNGTHVSESKDLVEGILRKDWGFEGMVMSDWWGSYSTTESIKAGLDLEMPGPTMYRGGLLGAALRAEKVTVDDIDARALQVLRFIKLCLRAPISYPDKPERGIDTPETRELLRRSARDAIVLLKNDKKVLPLQLGNIKKITVLGQNAEQTLVSGGGSAAMRTSRAISPLAGIQEAVGSGVEVAFSVGAYAHKLLPALGKLLKTPSSGGKAVGFDLVFWASDPFASSPSTDVNASVAQAYSLQLDDTYCFMSNDSLPGISGSLNFAQLVGLYTPDRDGDYEFGVTCDGKARIFVDGKLVVDNWDHQTPGENFFGQGTIEERGSVALVAGQTYTVTLNFVGGFRADVGVGKGAFRLGAARVIDEDEEIKVACELAQSSDATILVCGTNAEWESEGFDRKNMRLPPSVDKLVSAVLAVAPNTIIVNQSGTPVEMPWIDEASTVLHSWFGGNETGHAIADIIFGKGNPSGKLAQSFPVRLQDSPGFLGFPGENGKLFYNDNIFVGYRGLLEFERTPLFPFGHGLSYSTFSLSSLSLPRSPVFSPSTPSGTITFSVSLTNTSKVAGSEVVQVYILPPSTTKLERPKKELKSFAKVYLGAGGKKDVSFTLDKIAISYWDDRRDCWVAEKGTYGIWIGSSSVDEGAVVGEFGVEEEFTWRGL